MSALERSAAFALLVLVAGTFGGCAQPRSEGSSQNAGWQYYGSDEGFKRYASLDQIDSTNVGQLAIAWERPGVDSTYRAVLGSQPYNHYLNSTPIYVDGTLYAPDALGFVEAFDPATGATKWTQKPRDDKMATLFGRSTRGISYWSDGSAARLVGVRGQYLFELDPATGEAVTSFGDGGSVLLTPPDYPRFGWSSGPIVVGDVIVVGGTFGGAGDEGMKWKGRKPDDIRGFDVQTGEQVWTFHVVPREGEPGTDTWGNDSWKHSGDLGAWGPPTADEDLGYVYVATTAPTSAYYGGHRPGDNLYSNSLIALDAATGKKIWHYQMVHHDVWEFDNVGPPILGTLNVDGREVKAVMQANKNGFLYVLDRVTGEPVWPIEERSVPASDVPDEKLSPTQPFPTKPPAFLRQGITKSDLLDFTPELKKRAEAIADSFRTGPLYTPPSIVSKTATGTKGTLTVPGSWGGANWNTGAFDPETGLYYAVSNTIPRVYRLEKATAEDTEMEYWSPEREAPYIDGLPIVRPPWGHVTALDLNQGTKVWEKADGEGPRDNPALKGLDVGYLGIASRPVPLVTRTLLFLGEGSNVNGGIPDGMWGKTFRAYDKATGRIVWEKELPSATTGGPMTYMHDGKQYIVVALGSREDLPEWVALALP